MSNFLYSISSHTFTTKTRTGLRTREPKPTSNSFLTCPRLLDGNNTSLIKPSLAPELHVTSHRLTTASVKTWAFFWTNSSNDGRVAPFMCVCVCAFEFNWNALCIMSLRSRLKRGDMHISEEEKIVMVLQPEWWKCIRDEVHLMSWASNKPLGKP